MSFIEILNIIFLALSGAAFSLVMYFQVRGNLLAVVSQFIATAEKTGLKGSEKMAQVVSKLYERVPAFLKKFLTEEKLEKIAQWIFDWMREYADSYMSALDSTKGDDEALQKAADVINAEAVAKVVSELVGLTLEAMKEKAKECGVDPDGLTTKKEVIQAIVKVILDMGKTGSTTR